MSAMSWEGPLARPEEPPVLPGFEQIQRFWEPDTQRWTVKILPGEYYVTRSDEAITTVLGSCISACIRDPQMRVGGMNHFMLPEDNSLRERLEIKIFGGGRVLTHMTDIGARNINFVRDYLSTEGLRTNAQDVGGEQPRKVIYYPTEGRVRVRKLRPIENRGVSDREKLYLDSLGNKGEGGDIELFT